MKIREVTEQQINAALFDLEKKIDTKEGEKQVNSDWDSTSGVSKILNKPNLAKVATSGSYNDLSDKPYIPGQAPVTSVNGRVGAVVLTATDVGALPSSTVIPAAQVNSDWNASSGVAAILNKPSLATVATSGDYNDLSNKPTIPAAQVNSDWNASSGVAEILNKPTIPTLQDIFDVSHPVGEVYVQFPQQDAPATLYNQNGITSTWIELDYGGKFFRASGGNALTFAEASDTLTVQANQNKYHRHTHSHTHAKGTYRIQGQVGYVQFMSGVTSSGALTTTEQGSPNSAWDGSSSARQLIKLDTSARSGAGWTGASAVPNDSNTSYNGSSTDTEARPDNYTIKIWKRTA